MFSIYGALMIGGVYLFINYCGLVYFTSRGWFVLAELIEEKMGYQS